MPHTPEGLLSRLTHEGIIVTQRLCQRWGSALIADLGQHFNSVPAFCCRALLQQRNGVADRFGSPITRYHGQYEHAGCQPYQAGSAGEHPLPLPRRYYMTLTLADTGSVV